MSRASSKTKAVEPVKIDPAAPAPMPPQVGVRGRASRPTFRRGGLVFNDRDWTPFDPEISDEALITLFAEPVLTVQVMTSEGWRTLTADERAAAIAKSQTSAED
ncbi:hypothetical protein JIP62_06210 [Brevundimonas vitis]|uniref:Tail assembly chaperone n=1 Tax=Brevundimonas vitisensis TaxID=2800818 RepID=A0ABX7BQ10_9CAUL|nr:hypothetical protein [Brevundimonas vitisensis]QQQ19677.1 hypothetical protein JIP62_06210 [Brevundimonas vitisensis]